MNTYTYIPNFIKNHDEVFKTLLEDLAWERRESTPRLEYYANKVDTPYTYGRGRGVRTYLPMPWHASMDDMREKLEAMTGTPFEVCFLNRYEDQSDHLGWHADDSPEMDDARPIAIISLGVEREIWFRLNVFEIDKLICKEKNIESVDELSSEDLLACRKILGEPTTKLKLEHGSLCLMHAGMQDTHEHKIPKASFTCGKRISLTYRGYVI